MLLVYICQRCLHHHYCTVSDFPLLLALISLVGITEVSRYWLKRTVTIQIKEIYFGLKGGISCTGGRYFNHNADS
tara:strand:- start:293 stop:517 length:225 start_codon:yes stop_codon:yes gene_type:complete